MNRAPAPGGCPSRRDEHDEAAPHALAMRAAGTVALLLPGACCFLRDAGAPIAVATDHNPGSSPCLSVLMMLNMACTPLRLTPEEAWRGVTVNAARELAYRFGHNPCRRVVCGGVEREPT
jgi:imidazolonepropionase